MTFAIFWFIVNVMVIFINVDKMKIFQSSWTIPTSFLFFILSTCFSYGCQKKGKFESASIYNSQLDSTYIYKEDSLFTYEKLTRDGCTECFELPALSEWDEVVRIRGESSWGDFDYICSVYNGETKRIQLINQGNKNPCNKLYYSNYEKILSAKDYEDIIQLLINNNIVNMPFNLDPNFGGSDFPTYDISIKDNKLVKTTFWNDMYNLDSKNKIAAIHVFKEILRMANYPLPKIFLSIKRETEDSLYYNSGISDYDLITDYKASIRGHSLKKKNEGYYEIALAKNEVSMVGDLVQFTCFLSNGDSVKVKEFEIDNSIH